MKRSILVLVLIPAFLTSLAAQTPTPHYVVIDDAEAEISELEIRNREMARANELLEEENSRLNADIDRSEAFILQADEMIDRLSASAGEIYTLLQNINDPETRRELQNRMDENRKSRYDLENRKRRENEAISGSEDQIEGNRKMIAVNRVRSKANDQRIEYLQACIDLSMNENRDVDSVLDTADRVRLEVEQLLNR